MKKKILLLKSASFSNNCYPIIKCTLPPFFAFYGIVCHLAECPMLADTNSKLPSRVLLPSGPWLGRPAV